MAVLPQAAAEETSVQEGTAGTRKRLFRTNSYHYFFFTQTSQPSASEVTSDTLAYCLHGSRSQQSCWRGDRSRQQQDSGSCKLQQVQVKNRVLQTKADSYHISATEACSSVAPSCTYSTCHSCTATVKLPSV